MQIFSGVLWVKKNYIYTYYNYNTFIIPINKQYIIQVRIKYMHNLLIKTAVVNSAPMRVGGRG